MRVPKEALRLRSSGPVSGGENTHFGIVQAAAAPVALAPIIIPALGITIIVAISLEIIRNATSGPDCKKVKQECINYCSDTTLPTHDYGWKFQNARMIASRAVVAPATRDARRRTHGQGNSCQNRK